MDIIRPTAIDDEALVSSTVFEDDYGAWVAETTYAAAERCIVTSPNIHKIYESLQAGNTNHYPPENLGGGSPWWEEIGPTNRWRAFDGKVGTQTSDEDIVGYALAPGLIDSIALLQMDAVSVTLVMTDPADGEVYNEEVDLVSTLPVIDWLTYFFEPFVMITDLVRLNLPLYGDAVLAISINYAGGTAKVGGIVVGMKRRLGTTLYEPEVGIVDYSVKAVDDQGAYDVSVRAFSKRMLCPLRVPNTSIDEVMRLLMLYRSDLLVWVGVESYASMIVYGFYKDFSIVMAGPRHSDCAIEIEGLL